MSYSQKYTIVQFLEPQDEGFTFHMDEWPLHTTLADVFAVELTDDLIKDLAVYLSNVRAMSVHANIETTLGSGIVHASLLENSVELQALHDGLVEVLDKHKVQFNNPQFTKNGFLPHVSHQGDNKPRQGSLVVVDQLAIIDMFTGGDWRKREVLKLLDLAYN